MFITVFFMYVVWNENEIVCQKLFDTIVNKRKETKWRLIKSIHFGCSIQFKLQTNHHKNEIIAQNNANSAITPLCCFQWWWRRRHSQYERCVHAVHGLTQSKLTAVIYVSSKWILFFVFCFFCSSTSVHLRSVAYERISHLFLV